MTDAELQAIKARCDAATPGPWEEVVESGFWWITGPEADTNYVVSTMNTDKEDVEFITHAREDVPVLVADVEELRQLLAAYREQAMAATAALNAEKHRGDVAEQERDQALASLAAVQPISGDTSDGYHTFNELYRHRCLLFAWVLLLNHKRNVFKTLKNDAGEEYDGWFIGAMNTQFGQISYHLPDSLWDLLPITTHERNSTYDGHTSLDVLGRIERMVKHEAYWIGAQVQP